MRIFKHKEIFKERSNNKNRKIHKFYLYIFLIFFIMLFSLYGIHKDKITYNGLFNNIYNMQVRKEIFVYLKNVQPLEDKFYKLVNENIDFTNKKIHQGDYDINLLKEQISKIDSIMMDLASVETNQYMLENQYLFLDEMKIMRDIMIEKKLSIETQDTKNLVKLDAYLEKYFLIGKIRRTTLIKIFNKYDIVYLELDNRIKYKIK